MRRKDERINKKNKKTKKGGENVKAGGT